MASEELKTFLSSVNIGYLKYADVIHKGEFTSQAELGAADRTDLQDLKIPKGAAGLIIAAARGAGDSIVALLFHYQPLVVCTAFQYCDLCLS
jgi:hypothetical protein